MKLPGVSRVACVCACLPQLLAYKLSDTSAVLGAGEALSSGQNGSSAAHYSSKVGRGGCDKEDIILSGPGYETEQSVQLKCTELTCTSYVWSNDTAMGYHVAWFCSSDIYDSINNAKEWPKWKVGRNDTQAARKNCDSWLCVNGYVPKKDHHDILLDVVENPSQKENGVKRGDKHCCEPTCSLWTCGDNYTNNSAYDRNIGWTNEQCCDLACGRDDVKCPAGYVVTEDMKLKGGLTADDCCTATCASVACVEPKASYPENHTKMKLLSTDQGVCCQDTCASIGCPVGKTHDLANLRSATTDPAVCCVPMCQSFVMDTGCRNGYEPDLIHLSDVAGDGKKCCKLKCGDMDGRYGYKCGEGWVPHGDSRSCRTQPCTDDQCCVKTCGIFECPAKHVPHEGRDHWWPASVKDCCQKTCALHECSSSRGYVPGTNFKRNATVSEDPNVCCDKFCSLHTCGHEDFSVIPDGDVVAGEDDTTCCEPKICQVFRDMTLSSGSGCMTSDHAAITTDECNDMYTEVFNTKLNHTEYIRCYWDDIHSLCRLSNAEITGNKMPSGCSGM